MSAVRELIAAAPVPEKLREWSRQKELLRTLVAAVDNVAQGQSPAVPLAFLAPKEKFSVREKNGTILLDPRSFRRYDALVDVFVAIPDETLVFWYRKLSPTLEAAFSELGYPGITFAQRLKQACEQLGQVPLIRHGCAPGKKGRELRFRRQRTGRPEPGPKAHAAPRSAECGPHPEKIAQLYFGLMSSISKKSGNETVPERGFALAIGGPKAAWIIQPL